MTISMMWRCYRKKSLYVTRENAVKLKKNEYFIADLIGLKVISDEGEDLGELTDVLQTGANDVYCDEAKRVRMIFYFRRSKTV